MPSTAYRTERKYPIIALAFVIFFLALFPSITSAQSYGEYEPLYKQATETVGASGTTWRGRKLSQTEWESGTINRANQITALNNFIASGQPGGSVEKLLESTPNRLEQQGKIIAANQQTSGCNSSSWSVICLWEKFMKLLGAFFLWIGGTVLQLAGIAFNWLVTYVIVQFGSTIKSLQIIDGVHSAWTVLRDLSNIVIIGMFTFIAISIIIGNHTFGEKKLVAKVLVVAVLINFSLLFSKIIIDTSNFIAFQVYKAMSQSDVKDANIAGKFLAAAGITKTFSKDFTSATGAGERAVTAGSVGATDASSFYNASQGFFHGLVGGAVLLFAAGVLLYGCYLIIARAILLIFLMLVSALAFATYLVPNLSGGEYGWSTWWKSLINASIFGPLLMILLYVSLVVITKMPSAPQKEGDWLPIFSLAVGIGMLYVSFKVANNFAGKIAGFPSSIPNLVNPLAPLVGTSRLLGLMGRSSIGRLADRRQAAVQKAMTDRVGPDGKQLPARWTQRLGSSLYGSIAKREFDALKTKSGASLVEKLGGPKILEKAGEGGYRGTKERQAKAAVHSAEADTESTASAKKRYEEKERDNIRQEMLTNIRGMREEAKAGKGKASEDPKLTKEQRDLLQNEIRAAARDGSGPGESRSSDAVNMEAARQHSASEARTRMSADAAHIAQAAAQAATAASEETKQAGLSLKDTEARLAEFDAQEKALRDGSYKFTDAQEAQIRLAGAKGEHAAHAATTEFAKSMAWWTPGTMLGDNKAEKKTSDVFEKEKGDKSLKKALQLIAEQNDGHKHGNDDHKPTKVEVVNNRSAPVVTKAAAGDGHGHG